MNRISWAKMDEWDSEKLVGTSSIKQRNRSKILKSLITGPHTRAELARENELSAPTVSRIISGLIADGIVSETGIQQTGDVGAPGSFLAFNGSSGYVIGVDIGESEIRLCLADLFGTILDEDVTQAKARLGGMATVEQIVNASRHLLEKNGIPFELFRAICVGVPGTVVLQDGTICVNAPDINGWVNFPLKRILAKELNIGDCFLENAQNLAVISEHSSGCAVNYSNVVFLQIKGGIGAGLLLNGELFRGAGGKAGEVAFSMSSTTSVLPDKSNGRARHGSIEKEIGIEMLLAKLGFDTKGLEADDLPSLQTLYEKAAGGDAGLLRAIRESWDLIGMMSVNICSLLNPELIVLGGDILPLADELKARIEELLQKYCLDPCEVKISMQGARASVIGAVQVACGRVYRQLGI